MQNYLVCKFAPALLTVGRKEKHHDWAKMAAEEELEVYMQDGVVFAGKSLVTGGAVRVYMSSSSAGSGAAVQVAD